MTDSPPQKLQVWWKTTDFRPAPPGWRVVSLFGDRRSVVPMPGWLIQERYLIDDKDQVVSEPDEHIWGRQSRVTPGIAVEGYNWCVEPIDENTPPDTNTWMVLAPDQPEPGEQEQAAEIQRRADAAARDNAAKDADQTGEQPTG